MYYDFFLAHAGADATEAEQLYDLLAAEVRVFLDSRSLILGDDWDKALTEAQQHSRVTVVLVSANTDDAFYQREEIAAAIALARKGETAHRVVPVYLHPFPDNVPYGLRLKHGLTVSDQLPIEQVAARLVDLHRWLTAPATRPEAEQLDSRLVATPPEEATAVPPEPQAIKPPLAAETARSAEPSFSVARAGTPQPPDLKRVRDFPDPIVLGVHPAADRHGATGAPALDRVPPYAPREFDSGLRSLLRSSGFILLTGPSTAGKSRAAYEAVRAAVPGHRLLVPGERKDLLPALSCMQRELECVLWLDDLERFIGADGLTHPAIAHVLMGHQHHRIIMATMRDGALKQYQDGASDDTGGQIGRNVRRVLDQAVRIRVEPFFSVPERAEAEKISDPRIREALAYAGTYGLAEYLAAGPELLARWNEAWGGGNPVGAALVAAAVDCRRAGLAKAAPKRLVEELRFAYLGMRGRDRRQQEDLEVAWAWATSESEAGIALLMEVDGPAYVVFDYLVDHAQGDRTAESFIPREVLDRILGEADPGEAQMIGWTARSQGYDDVACRAFGQSYEALIASLGANHPETLYAQASVAYATYHLGRFKEAESSLRAVITRSERILGSRDPLTLSSRIDLAYLLTDTSRLGEAETEFKSILNILTADDDQYITAQNGLAIAYLESGQAELAERQFQEVITASAERYGPDYRGTLIPRCYKALAIERQDREDRLDEAEDEQRRVLGALVAAFGEQHSVTLQSRSNLAAVLRKQGRLSESEREYTTVLRVRTNVLGESHPATLGGCACLAAVLAEQGRLAEARAVYGVLIGMYSRTFGRSHRETVKIRQELAATLQKMGKLSEAKKQYTRILNVQERTLGHDHLETLATRQIIDSLAQLHIGLHRPIWFRTVSYHLSGIVSSQLRGGLTCVVVGA